MSVFSKLAIGFCSMALCLSVQAVPVTHLGGTFDMVGTIVDNDTADFLYTADFTNWAGASDYIFALDFKVEGFDISSVTAFSTTATGNWVTADGPSNANGCGGVNGSFVCAEDDPFSSSIAQATSGIVTWNFTVDFTSDITFADLDNSNNHIGAFFMDCTIRRGVERCNGKEGLSTGTAFTSTSVPEPSSFVVLGLGVLMLGASRFRKQS